MSQQTSGLSRFVQIIGRYSILIGLLALLGGLAGAVFAALHPPGTTSRAQVLYVAPSCPADGAICGGPLFSPKYSLAPVLNELPNGVQIELVNGSVISVSATAGTMAQAEANAEAVVRTYIAYVGSLNYLGEQPSARVLEPATAVAGTTPPKQVFGDALLGAVFGALVGVITALASSRSTIEPVALPQGPGVGGSYWEAGQASGPYWGAGQENGPALAEFPLQQLAREYMARRAAGDSPPMEG
jgi:hypothetical protein